MKQFAPAVERNRDPILAVLRDILPPGGDVLEIGAGTGQHAAYFASHFPALSWQPTDLPPSLASIEAWRREAGIENLRPPRVLDLLHDQWPVERADVVVCINTVHIVAWKAVQGLFAGIGGLLADGGLVYLYGPFRYRDRPLETSNEQFDHWLRTRDPQSGIREFEAIDALAAQVGLRLEGDRAMPANNRSIWWRREGDRADAPAGRDR